ncbi:hypothetical protein HDU76_012715 [Blyttiomyces sp. JEL0837]|nr:hypothetical protein HDU76_012715 [Blyttiomyces sp. JEL0837]
MAANLQVVAATTSVVAVGTLIATLLYWSRRKLRLNSLGTMPITTDQVRYDQDSNGDVLSWDKHSLMIDGQRVMILSGEFHPWRVPDRERWRPILEMYKAAGLNCIRIYFHWGYHSPAEGVYYFDGNRDMDYLLTLCEELRLFVLCAPGPYICAETQAGGHPIWLVAKRDVRIRHSVRSFYRKYDPEYSRHCQSWFQALLPIIARHQITNDPSKRGPGARRGCVLALQIENENFENFKGVPLGLADDMKFLCQTARQCGITVPLFHNDAWEEGSFIAHESPKRSHGKETFGLDLYSFDKYVVFAPTSAPLSTVMGGENNLAMWKDWTVDTVEKALDNMEKTVRKFGGCAANGPIFIAELQGGWFNHYTLKCSYDTIYSYYGENYTRLIFDTVLSQGTSMLNYYMFYGGTNWGTLGDPDVYTSYDYSACIREFGFLSGRARKLRQGIMFARSFATLVSATDPIESNARTIIVTPNKILSRQRISVATSQGELSFFRNFTNNKKPDYTVHLERRTAVTLKGSLPYKQSFIALGNYKSVESGLHLLFSTMPIHLRIKTIIDNQPAEVWVVQSDNVISGQMAFHGDVKFGNEKSTLRPDIKSVPESLASVVSFTSSKGWFSLRRATTVDTDADEQCNDLYIIALSGDDLYTLTATFENQQWFGEDGGVKIKPDLKELVKRHGVDGNPLLVAWGAYNIRHDIGENHLEVEWRTHDQSLFVLFAEEKLHTSNLSGYFQKHEGGANVDDPYVNFPGLYIRKRATTPTSPVKTANREFAKLSNWWSRSVDFTSWHWQSLELKPLTVSNLVVNRCTVYVNGTVLGGHTTYSLQLFKPGAKNGPDPYPDWTSFTIPKDLLIKDADNEIILLIESFGLSRQAFALNDVRNPRGLIGVKLVSSTPRCLSRRVTKVEFKLQVAGVDVTTIQQPYGISGLPDESSSIPVTAPVGALAETKTETWTPYVADVSNASTSTTGLTATPSVVDSAVTNTQQPPTTILTLSNENGSRPRWFHGTFTIEFQAHESIRKTGFLGIVASTFQNSSSATTTPHMYKSTTRIPLRLCVSGPGTAHVFIGGIYIARYYGNGDSVQRDFVIPESLVGQMAEEDGVSVRVLVYGREKGDWVGLQVKGWEIEEFEGEGSMQDRWSGNSKNGGDVFLTFKETISI